MIRSLVFTTQGRLHSKDIEMFLMPTLLSDTNLFLWVDLENPTPDEAKYVLELNSGGALDYGIATGTKLVF